MNRLWVRLSLAFTAVALLAAGLLVTGALLLAGSGEPAESLASRAAEPGGLVDLLADAHAETGSWAGADRILQSATYLAPAASPGEVLLELVDAEGRPLAAAPQGAGLPPEAVREVPIVSAEGETLGSLRVSLSYEPAALREGTRMLLRFALLCAVLGTVFGLWMGRSLARPLVSLAGAARALGSGDRSQRVEESGTDEIQDVARAFNDMAADLESQELLRRDMVADIAHELRTPLSMLQANLEAILDGVLPLEPAEVARLADQARLLSRLVADLRELAMAEAGQLELAPRPLDLAGLLADTAAAFAPLAEMTAVRIEVEAAPDLPPALADKGRMEQVLQNLVSNAVRHSPEGGRVRLRAGRDEGEPGEAVGMLLVSVLDEGPGLSAEERERVFDRFYRADGARARQTGGAGLGLAIARSIVEAHGGSIRAEEAPGGGADFVVVLPVAGAVC